MLSREVAKHVTVVQSGQGADEVFAGYHWYPPLADSNDPVADYARVFFDRDQREYERAVHPRFHGTDYSRAFVERHFAEPGADRAVDKARSEEHTSELQSLMRSSYAVFCLKKKKTHIK